MVLIIVVITKIEIIAIVIIVVIITNIEIIAIVIVVVIITNMKIIVIVVIIGLEARPQRYLTELVFPRTCCMQPDSAKLKNKVLIITDTLGAGIRTVDDINPALPIIRNIPEFP